MTDDKIEAAAREAAIDHGEWLEADADETNCDSFVAGFKAGHASRDAEIAKKDEEIADWRESARKAASETCGPMDGLHCTCVGVLRHEIAELRAKLAAMREPLWMLREEHEAETADLRARLEAAEARAPRWATEGSDEWYSLMAEGWRGVYVAEVRGEINRFMVSPVPLPGTEQHK